MAKVWWSVPLLILSLGLSAYAQESQEPPAPTPIEFDTTLEVNGILVHPAPDTQIRYCISYLYGDLIWANRLSRDGTRQGKAPLQFTRWQLNYGWSYIPATAGVKSKLFQGRKRFVERAPESSSSADPAILKGNRPFLQVGNTLYVGGSRKNTLVAIDLATGKPDPTKLNQGAFKDEANLLGPMAVAQIGNTLYVAGSQSNTLMAIDLATGKPDPTKFNQGVFKDETNLKGPFAVAQVGNTLYVAGSQSNTLVAIDLTSGRLDTTKLNQGIFKDEANLRGPQALFQIGNTLYVAGSQSNTLVAIDLTSGRLDTRKLEEGVFKDEANLQGPQAILQIGNTLYVAGSQSHTLVAISLETGQLDPTKLENGTFKDEANLQGPLSFSQVGNTFSVAGSESRSVVTVDSTTGKIHTASMQVSPSRPPVAGSGPGSKVSAPSIITPEKNFQEVVLLSVQEAIQQEPELIRRMPPQTQGVILMSSIRVYCSKETRGKVTQWIRQAWPSPELQDAVKLEDLSKMSPHGIAVVEGALPASSAKAARKALVDLKRTPMASWTALLSSGLSQLTGKPISQIVGAVRLRDGRTAVFVQFSAA